MAVPSEELIRKVPKVLRHDHVDGGLRPSTVAELAQDIGYAGLPATGVLALTDWFHGAAAASGALDRYLEAVNHTVAVMQTEDAFVRVARECAEDLAADGIVYAEVRFAERLHLINDVIKPGFAELEA